ncbi:hypothetical protein OIU77_024139 [Salix suchowensis]|uniref:Uncharacterized protein n=1 Tax=Salix suchowensis TaxID=1278906 RepID=A0ABQ8ZGF4_9ROSI|nr:hypothetical protein OIU77_024139 [Salix suchowensis]
MRNQTFKQFHLGGRKSGPQCLYRLGAGHEAEARSVRLRVGATDEKSGAGVLFKSEAVKGRTCRAPLRSWDFNLWGSAVSEVPGFKGIGSRGCKANSLSFVGNKSKFNVPYLPKPGAGLCCKGVLRLAAVRLRFDRKIRPRQFYRLR